MSVSFTKTKSRVFICQTNTPRSLSPLLSLPFPLLLPRSGEFISIAFVLRVNFIKLWTNPASQAQAFDLETEPLNFHSPNIKQCEWLPAIQPTSHTATPTSFISPVHLLLTHCMQIMRGRGYVLLKHNPNCFLVLLLHISCYRKPWAIWSGESTSLCQSTARKRSCTAMFGGWKSYKRY